MNYDWMGPAATAAVVTAIVTLFTSYRNHSLDQVTSERSTWRLRIKTAIQELLAAFGDSKATVLALQMVKSEINPYGRFTTNMEIEQPAQNSNKPCKFLQKLFAVKKKKTIDNAPYYLRDGHIWNAISDYEAAPADRKALDTLIVLLELLLKFDWERSKREVAGFTTLIPAVLLCAVGSISFALGTTNEIELGAILSYAAVVFAIFLLLIFLPPYCLFKGSVAHEPSNVKTFLASFLVIVPAIISYLCLLAGNQHFSMLVASIASGVSAFLSIIAAGKRDIERRYISMIRSAIDGACSKTKEVTKGTSPELTPEA